MHSDFGVRLSFLGDGELCIGIMCLDRLAHSLDVFFRGRYPAHRTLPTLLIGDCHQPAQILPVERGHMLSVDGYRSHLQPDGCQVAPSMLCLDQPVQAGLELAKVETVDEPAKCVIRYPLHEPLP